MDQNNEPKRTVQLTEYQKKLLTHQSKKFGNYFCLIFFSLITLFCFLLLIFSLVPFSNGETKSGVHEVITTTGQIVNVKYYPDTNALYVFNGNSNNNFAIALASALPFAIPMFALIYLKIQYFDPYYVKNVNNKAATLEYIKIEQAKEISNQIDITMMKVEEAKNDQ